MQRTREFLMRYSLVIGIPLMVLLIWPVMPAHSGVLWLDVSSMLDLLIGWGVSMAALVTTGLSLGREGVLGLPRRFLIWRVRLRWYVVALLRHPAILADAIGLVRLRIGELSPSPVL